MNMNDIQINCLWKMKLNDSNEFIEKIVDMLGNIYTIIDRGIEQHLI